MKIRVVVRGGGGVYNFGKLPVLILATSPFMAYDIFLDRKLICFKFPTHWRNFELYVLIVRKVVGVSNNKYHAS